MQEPKYTSCRNFIGFKVTGEEYKEVARMAEKAGVSVNIMAKNIMLGSIKTTNATKNVR